MNGEWKFLWRLALVVMGLAVALNVPIDVRAANAELKGNFELLKDEPSTHQRGKVKIVDRVGLESAACNCYGKMKREFERILMSETGRVSLHRPSPQPSTDLS